MGYKPEAELDNMPQDEMIRFVVNNLPIGPHPTLDQAFYVPENDRYAGMCVLGLPGKGKSGELEMIFHLSAIAGKAAFFIDPHGDSIRKVIARLPEDLLHKTYLLDPLGDIEYPLTLDFFGKVPKGDVLALMRAVDRAMHLFELHWPDIMSQAHFPRYLRAALIVLLSNPAPTLLKLYGMLVNDSFRRQQLATVTDESVRQFWCNYDELTPSAKRQQIDPLLARLESFFMGRTVVRNILSHTESSVNFRKAIEDGDIILINLPIKTMAQDARLIGSILLAQIHTALFSFSDVPPDQRPGFSLIIDEWQNFASSDIAEMVTEGRKFKVKLCVANQFLAQLPNYLQEALMAMHTKVCFQLTPDDARQMAHLFPNTDTTVKPEDMERNLIEHLLKNGSDNPDVTTFIETYLRLIRNAAKKNGKMEVKHPGFMPQKWLNAFLHVPPPANPTVSDPLPDLNDLLYKAMKTGELPARIPGQVVEGFANCGRGFYQAFTWGLKDRLLVLENIQFPPDLVVQTPDGGTCWTRKPRDGKEQLYHFLYHLIVTIGDLTQFPIGKHTKSTATEVAQELMALPFRHAYVRSGDESGVIRTEDTFEPVSDEELEARLALIQAQTRQKYCRPKVEATNESQTAHKPHSRSEVI